MINIAHKKCKIKGCKNRAIYNKSNEKVGLYCIKHKLENMINVFSKKCVEENCNIIPSFNYENEKKPLYCVKHKKGNMINIVDSIKSKVN